MRKKKVNKRPGLRLEVFDTTLTDQIAEALRASGMSIVIKRSPKKDIIHIDGLQPGTTLEQLLQRNIRVCRKLDYQRTGKLRKFKGLGD